MPHSQVTAALAALVASGALTAAIAEDGAVAPSLWDGEASLSASASSGNTEANDLGASFKVSREDGVWTNRAGLALDYGDSANVETKNRIFGDYQLERVLSARSYGFGRATYEMDEFSGYESRSFLGVGYGRELILNDATSWSVQGGPGFSWDEERAELASDGVTVITPATTTNEVAVALGSRFKRQINEGVSLSNDSDVTWNTDATTLFNSLALTSTLMDALAARFSVDVTHNSAPPAGAESTDTITRASLVYSFNR